MVDIVHVGDVGTTISLPTGHSSALRDTIRPLTLVTGTDTSTGLTSTGAFTLRDAEAGDCVCALALAHDTGYFFVFF